jgi:hypothetical protein
LRDVQLGEGWGGGGIKMKERMGLLEKVHTLKIIKIVRPW